MTVDEGKGISQNTVFTGADRSCNIFLVCADRDSDGEQDDGGGGLVCGHHIYRQGA